VTTKDIFPVERSDDVHSTLEGLTDNELYLYESMLRITFPIYRDENVKSVKELTSDHLLVEFKSGLRTIFCRRGQEFLNIRDPEGYHSDAQILYEFKHMVIYWMRRRGMTQQQLAKMTGYSESAISRYINHNRMPDILVLSKLANALDVTIDAFFLYY
jgi:DNA-binding XRE family transcriptional regulator